MCTRSLRTLLFALAVVFVSFSAVAQIGISVTFAPPPLPIYEQPICPGDGYLWTPGYWAWDADIDDYYWVPGTWVMAPEVGFLWTPPYWGWGGSAFLFHEGFWGPEVGFYGGINYGFGYFGVGFDGGRWDNGHFFYNRAVLNVNVTEIHNVYETRVDVRNDNHVSFNGGNGGINARPSAREEEAERGRHIPPVAAQTQHMQQARANPQERASENRGKPAIAATARPGDFRAGAVQAREAGGNYTPPANRGRAEAGTNNRAEENARPGGNENRTENNARPGTAENNPARPAATPGHVRDLPPAERPAAPNTGNAKMDKKYQQQQDKQYAKQQQERTKLQQQQEKEDQKVAKQNNEARKQQVEQQHQQQTQQLQQRHEQQRQQMQQRMQSANRSRPPHK